jgi:hypothetical protein
MCVAASFGFVARNTKIHNPPSLIPHPSSLTISAIEFSSDGAEGLQLSSTYAREDLYTAFVPQKIAPPDIAASASSTSIVLSIASFSISPCAYASRAIASHSLPNV